MIDLIIAALALTEVVDDIGSVVIVLENEVYHPGDRVIPIGGTAAILQDFDTVDRCQRDGVEVHERNSPRIDRNRVGGKP